MTSVHLRSFIVGKLGLCWYSKLDLAVTSGILWVDVFLGANRRR